MDNQPLDQDVVALTKAIRQSESGGNFSVRGKSNEYGAYQFTPDTWNATASKYGVNVPLEQATKEQQNKVAYSRIKEWKDSGKNVGQIASMWNAGEDESGAYTGKFSNGQASIGKNKFGVQFDVPSYAKSVATAYHTIKGGGQVGIDPTNPSSVSSPTPPVPPAPVGNSLIAGIHKTFEGDSSRADTSVYKPTTFGGKALKFAGDITGQTGLGEDIGGAISDVTSNKQYKEALAQHNTMVQKLQATIATQKQSGKDTSRLEKVLGEIQTDAPKKDDFLSGVQNKTTAQILADIGQSGLGIAGGAVIPGGTAMERVVGGAVLGGGMGALGAVQGGETDLGKIGTQGAIGATLGLATGGLLEGASRAYQGLVSHFGTTEASKILSMSEAEVQKLPARDQKVWYKAQSDLAKEQSTALADKAKVATEQHLQTVQNDIQDFSQKIASTSKDVAVAQKEPAAKLYTEASNQYRDLVEASLAESGKSLETKIPVSEVLNEASSHESVNSPEDAQKLKDWLGFKEPTTSATPGETVKQPEVSLNDLWNKAKAEMQTISPAARSGNASYNAREYEAMKHYSFIMDVLGKNGMDLKEANAFWKSWAPVRKVITQQIKPFDEMAIQTPFAKTLRVAGTEAKTPAQFEAKIKAQATLTEIEKAMKVEPGTIGAEVTKLIKGREAAVQQKISIEELGTQIQKQLKQDKVEALKTISLKKFDAESQALKKERIRNAIFKVLEIAGITGVIGAGAYGLMKASTK